ncbi:hypothetical protein HAX54_029506 [Datura stramonium]|uniref:Uncharacterized protein n=1 Tax=Datura stramonium TaxID=4076 RepID=A0ABS8V8B0_DATST|nr:hypothetical protein [Datura stramonium]
MEHPGKKPTEEGGGRGDSSFRNNNNSSGSREEGELSASDNDDQNVCSDDQLTISDAAPLEQQVHIGTVNENFQDIQAEKMTSSSKMGYSIDVPSRTPQEAAHMKSSKKNREHFVPFLISFSDDSGSDCENSGQKKISASKNRTLAADKFIKPPAPAPRRPEKLQKITRKMPSKGDVSHKVSSLLSKPSGGTSENAGHLHSFRKFNNSNVAATLDHGKRANVHLNSSKLRDLRQLIAIRENQLNLERLQNTKKLTSASCRDVNLGNKSNLVVRASRETTCDSLQELKEPEKKRQKIVPPDPSLGFSNSQEIMPMVIGSEKCALKDSNQLEPVDHSSHGEKYPSCSVIAGQLKQKEYQGSSSSANPSLTLKDGIDAVRNHNQSSSNSSKEVASKAANKLVLFISFSFLVLRYHKLVAYELPEGL